MKNTHAGILEYARVLYTLSPDLECLEFTPELCDAFFGLYYQLDCCYGVTVKEALKIIDEF